MATATGTKRDLVLKLCPLCSAGVSAGRCSRDQRELIIILVPEGQVPRRRSRHVNIRFVATIAVITADPPQARKLLIDTLGLPLRGEDDGYYSSGEIAGCKHLGVWPLSQAAEACFGTPEWPGDRPVPQASIEFDVEDVQAVAVAGEELQRAGFELLHEARTEPWGQTVERLLTTDGLIVGISYTPAFHEHEQR
jgi:hypothetical protein